MTKIEELKAAYEAATGEEWAAESAMSSDVSHIRYITADGKIIASVRHRVEHTQEMALANAAFIALAHNLMPALLEAVGSMHEVLRISDRKHEAWDRARTALEKLK